MIYWTAKQTDKMLSKHFKYYIAKTQTAMFEFDQAIEGHIPDYLPELKGLNPEASHELQKQCIADLRLNNPIPVTYYANKQQLQQQ